MFLIYVCVRGARVSNCNPPTVSSASSNGSTKQKAETLNGLPVLGTLVSGSVQSSNFASDTGKKQVSNDESHAEQTKLKIEISDTVKQHAMKSRKNVKEGSFAVSGPPSEKSSLPAMSSVVDGSGLLSYTNSVDGQPGSPLEDKGNSSVMDVNMHEVCSEISSISMDKQLNSEEVIRLESLSLNGFLSPRSQGLLRHDSEKLEEHSSLIASKEATTSVDSLAALNEVSDLRSDTRELTIQNLTSETEDDFNNQRLRDAIVVNQSTTPMSSPLHLLSHLRLPLQPQTDADSAVTYSINPPVNRVSNESLESNVSGASVTSNGFLDHFFSHTMDQDSSMLLKAGQGKHLESFDGKLINFEPQPALDMGENNIISNILSLDLDSWDDSLTSPQILAKLLRETDKQEGPVKLAGSSKGQNSDQSRFSFARQDSRNHFFDIESSLGNSGQMARNPSFGEEFLGSRGQHFERIGNGFGFPHCNFESSDNMTSGHSIFPSSKVSCEYLTYSGIFLVFGICKLIILLHKKLVCHCTMLLDLNVILVISL